MKIKKGIFPEIKVRGIHNMGDVYVYEYDSEEHGPTFLISGIPNLNEETIDFLDKTAPVSFIAAVGVVTLSGRIIDLSNYNEPG